MPTIKRINIDPHGDTLIVLHHSADGSSPSSHYSPSPDDPCPTPLLMAPPSTDGASEEAHHAQDLLHPVSPGSRNSADDLEYHFKVSSTHLSLASRRAALTVKDLMPLNAEGLRRWVLEANFNPAAFDIVMNIIHLQTQRLPVSVNLGMMADLATVVDDLECHSAVSFFANTWIQSILGPGLLDSADPKELSQWVLISSVFRHGELFTDATLSCILNNSFGISSFGMPIRPKIIDELEERRSSAIISVIEHLNDLIVKLSQENQFCTIQCQSILLGALVRQMHLTQLSANRPFRPQNGMSLSGLLRIVRGFNSPKVFSPRGVTPEVEDGNVWNLDAKRAHKLPTEIVKRKASMVSTKSTQSTRSASPGSPAASAQLPKVLVGHKCTLHALIEPHAKLVEDGIKGLELGDCVDLSGKEMGIVGGK